MKNPLRLVVEIVGGVLILCIGISIGRAEVKNSYQMYTTTNSYTQASNQGNEKNTDHKEIESVVNMNEYKPGKYTLFKTGNGNATLREIETENLSVLRVKQTGTGELAAYDDLSSSLLCANDDDFSMDVILKPHTKYQIRIESAAEWEISVYEVKCICESMFTGDGQFATPIITSTTNEFHLYLRADSYFVLSIYKPDGESEVIAFGEGTYSGKITVPKNEKFCFLLTGLCEDVALKPIY